MKSIAAGVFALFMVVQLTGCARNTTTQATHSTIDGSQITGAGLKQPSQVQQCCRPLAEGRISIDQCMENPACKANNRTCCMQAIQ